MEDIAFQVDHYSRSVLEISIRYKQRVSSSRMEGSSLIIQTQKGYNTLY